MVGNELAKSSRVSLSVPEKLIPWVTEKRSAWSLHHIYYIIGKAAVTFSRPRSYIAAGSFLGCLGTRKIVDVILVILGLNRLHKIVYPSGFDDGRTPGCSLSTLGLQSQSIKLNTQSPPGNQRGSGDESMTPTPMEPSLSAAKKGVHLGTPHLESPTFSRPSMYFHRL